MSKETQKVNIAIDFGTTNTLVATFKDEPEILKLPGLSYELCGIDLIPSAVGYSLEKGKLKRSIGTETQKLPENSVIRRMKRLATTKRYKKIHGRDIYYNQATKDFLDYLISSLKFRFLQSEIGTIVFTVPVDSFDTYRAIIDEVCEKALIARYHILDESTAAAIGYEAAISKDKPYMIIDFGGGTIDVSIVKLILKKNEPAVKVLGKSGQNFGGADIDDWLLEDIVSKEGLEANLSRYSDDEELRKKIEHMKIDLCETGQGEISYYDSVGEFTLSAKFDAKRLVEVLAKNKFNAIIQSSIDNALDLAYENGIRKRDIAQILLVGGSSQLAAFHEIIETNFPEKIKANNPFGAVVRGAAHYLNEKIVEDFLHHHYALQYFDQDRNMLEYEIIVPEGTQFPAYNVKKMIISLPFSGQTRAAIKVFEIARQKSQALDLVGTSYDENGNLVTEVSPGTTIVRKVPLNPSNPEFITINPPSIKGEDRLEVFFSVDAERLLRIQVLDMKTNTVLIKDKVIARLS
jgi:molecular chaperone DnaK (HSP70)